MIRIALLLLLLLASCTRPESTRLALSSGFGGTGHSLDCPAARLLPGDSGFGGTGHGADCGFGGTGVIGTITDFGSIWVNGLEIELTPGVKIASNLGHPVELAIGQQVITRTHPHALLTDHVEVFYPLAGEVEQRRGNRLLINGHTVIIDTRTQGLTDLQAGDWAAINAWPQGEHKWLATRIDPNPRHLTLLDTPTLAATGSRKALIQGGVVIRGDQAWLEPYHLQLGSAGAWRDRRFALAALQHVREHWRITAIRPLRQWQLDWRELVRELRDHIPDASHLRHHREFEPARETRQKGTESLEEHRQALRESREVLQDGRRQLNEEHDTLREQKGLLEEQREALKQQKEQKEEFKAQQEALKEQREQLKEQHEMLEEQREQLKEQHEMLEEQHEMLEEQHSMEQDLDH